MHTLKYIIINYNSSSFILLFTLACEIFICILKTCMNIDGRVQAPAYLGGAVGGGERSDVPACVFSLWDHPHIPLSLIFSRIVTLSCLPSLVGSQFAGVVCPEK